MNKHFFTLFISILLWLSQTHAMSNNTENIEENSEEYIVDDEKSDNIRITVDTQQGELLLWANLIKNMV